MPNETQTTYQIKKETQREDGLHTNIIPLQEKLLLIAFLYSVFTQNAMNGYFWKLQKVRNAAIYIKTLPFRKWAGY